MPHYHRRVIRIVAEDSPNVQAWLAQKAAGIEPTNEIIIEGVLTGAEYEARRKLWDAQRQCIGLDAQFYAGPEIKLFPILWLNRAEEFYRDLSLRRTRHAKGIGIDPAEGGDKTSMAAVDEFGLIELVSRKTPDTNVIPREALSFARKHGVAAENICIDAGGGGKQHADRLRAQGFNVRTVRFGEALILEPKRQKRQFPERVMNVEERYTYVNRRAQLFWEASMLLDPAQNPKGYAISANCCDWVCPLHGRQCFKEQLKVFPKVYDKEGRCRLPPKNKNTTAADSSKAEKTLVQLIGHSPDEADSWVFAHARNVAQGEEGNSRSGTMSVVYAKYDDRVRIHSGDGGYMEAHAKTWLIWEEQAGKKPGLCYPKEQAAIVEHALAMDRCCKCTCLGTCTGCVINALCEEIRRLREIHEVLSTEVIDLKSTVEMYKGECQRMGGR